ncbi:MAG: hypothetical protein MJ166_04180 [Clostridia bacterium]|nr:hypothetical protein [Clostridia bacterium]
MDIYRTEYFVDIVMVIDSTNSMGRFIRRLENDASIFYQKYLEWMEQGGTALPQVRIKVVGFCDYKCGCEPVICESTFFSLPVENAAFHEAVSCIEVNAIGDAPKCAYEALALAMQSDWMKYGAKRRQVILLFTDTPVNSFGDSNALVNSIRLRGMWNGLNGLETIEQQAKRMIVFVPNVASWSFIQDWDQVWISYVRPGDGCSEVDVNLIIELISNAIGM